MLWLWFTFISQDSNLQMGVFPATAKIGSHPKKGTKLVHVRVHVRDTHVDSGMVSHDGCVNSKHLHVAHCPA